MGARHTYTHNQRAMVFSVAVAAASHTLEMAVSDLIVLFNKQKNPPDGRPPDRGWPPFTEENAFQGVYLLAAASVVVLFVELFSRKSAAS